MYKIEVFSYYSHREYEDAYEEETIGAAIDRVRYLISEECISPKYIEVYKQIPINIEYKITFQE